MNARDEMAGPVDHDVHWMARALDLARHAESREGEVPVGAVIVLDGNVIGEGWNRNIAASDMPREGPPASASRRRELSAPAQP